MIPMVDLREQYHSIKAEIDSEIQSTIENTHFILGPNVKEFEKEVCEYLGVQHAISCASGTDALHLALVAAGVGPGDEVITTPFTFIATAEAICYTGATPVFVDIQADTYNIDPELVEAAITPKTRAILPVHLFGQPADMPKLMSIAAANNLLIIEDCAQSFGAHTSDGSTGSIGLAGCHSFFPSKNLGCYGDGGMVTTQSDEVAKALRSLRNHGSERRYYHDMIGYNSRLDELQAAILRVKLRRIDQYNENRRRVAHHYSGLLKDIVTTPHEDDKGTHVYHQYTILTEQRDAIMQALTENEIANAIYYPVPLHKQKVFLDLGINADMPVTEKICEQCMSLPVYPELSQESVEQIASVIRSVF
jgi:dTDP-4-amino-4,6-dideoxygalactose transaminase